MDSGFKLLCGCGFVYLMLFVLVNRVAVFARKKLVPIDVDAHDFFINPSFVLTSEIRRHTDLMPFIFMYILAFYLVEFCYMTSFRPLLIFWQIDDSIEIRACLSDLILLLYRGFLVGLGVKESPVVCQMMSNHT